LLSSFRPFSSLCRKSKDEHLSLSYLFLFYHLYFTEIEDLRKQLSVLMKEYCAKKKRSMTSHGGNKKHPMKLRSEDKKRIPLKLHNTKKKEQLISAMNAIHIY
jgi:hypothetical protein